MSDIKLKTIKEEQQRDQALYFVEEGDPGFNPAHNKFVIENTIKKYNAARNKKAKLYNEAIRERADAVATYIKSRVAEGGTPVEKYFGKKWMSYLRGEKIMEVLKQKTLVNGQKKQMYLTGN
jgi:hypothetical protein